MNILHVKSIEFTLTLSVSFGFWCFFFCCCLKLALLSLVFRNTSDGKASLKWQRTLETTMDTNGFTYDKHTDILVNACTLPYPYGAQ